MANYVPAWQIAQDNAIGRPAVSADSVQSLPGGGNGPPYVVPGLIVSAIEPFLGGGELMYVFVASAITAGQVVEFDNALDPEFSTGCIWPQVKPWAGTANSGKSLGVAIVAASANQFCFVQMVGNAAVNISGTITVGNGAWWEASGTVQGASAVASKQMLSAVAATAAGANIGTGSSELALPSTQAIYAIIWPEAQGAIT